MEVFSTVGILVNCGLLVTFEIFQKFEPEIDFYESIVLIIIVEV
jgi:hypothetical protein